VIISDFVEKVEKNNKEYFEKQQKEDSKIYHWICPNCKNTFPIKKLEEMIGKKELQQILENVKNNMEPPLITIHDHKVKKEDILKSLLSLNAKEPYIYDLHNGEKLRCFLQGCNKKISLNELKKIFGENDTQTLISNLRLELQKKPKSSKSPKFHCGLVDYEDSLKIAIQELIDYNNNLPVK